jgi:hypothetical protein
MKDFARHGGQAEQSIQDLSRPEHVALDVGKKAGALSDSGFSLMRGRDQAALALVCCKRRASLAVTIFPPTLQLPSFTSSIFTSV